MDIAAWLRDLGMERYEKAFRDNDIDAEVLPNLKADDLWDIGVTSVGHRRKLLDAIARLKDLSAGVEGELIDRDIELSRPPAGAQPAASEAIRWSSRSDAERRQLTVLFCDLVGSTELSARLDPEDMGALICSYQNCCSEAVRHWDGHVAKYMGDGVLAYFGWPQAHEDDAERAVRAGLDLRERIAHLTGYGGRPLAARVGIATGLVMVGDLIGEGAAQEQAVVGETPNLAARLQGFAEPGAVVVAQSTRQLLGSLFDLQDLGQHELKGLAGPIEAWSVIGASRAESRFDALRTAKLTALVGREQELAILMERWTWASEGEGQTVLLSGEPGIGKSRLLRELRQSLADEPHVALSYYCSPYHTDSALHPVIAQLQRAAGFAPGDEKGAQLTKLETLLGQGAHQLSECVPLIGALLSVTTDARYPVPEMSVQQRKQRTLEVLVDQLEGLARTRPVVMLFEDVHWVDPSTLELLDLLVERVRDLPIMLLITYRLEFVPPWIGQSHVTQLPLNRLGRRQGAALVDGVAGGKALPAEVMDQILAKTDGVPLFVEELTKTVLLSDWLRDVGDHYELAGPLPPLAIPATLNDSLMARLDRLASVKDVAQIASVIGREFSQELLTSISPLPEDHLLSALDQLVTSGLIFRRGTAPATTYSFKHALVRDAAYGSLLRHNRKRLHHRIAEALDGSMVGDPALLAHHWEQAEDLEKALKCRLQAGDSAADRFAVWEAVAHYWHALRLLDALPTSEEVRRLHLRTVLSMISTAAAGSETGDFWHDDGEREAAFKYIDDALETALANQDAAALAYLEAFKGKNEHDEALLASAAQHARSIGDRQLEADVVRQHAGHFGHMGRFDESEAYVDRAIELYEDLGARVEVGFAMASYGRCYRARAGKLEEALEFAERARGIAAETSDLKLRSWLAMESEALMYKGLWLPTVEVVRRNLPVAWEVGNWAVVLWSSAFATVAQIKLGNLGEAEALIAEALAEAAPRAGDDFPKIYPRIALSQLHLASGANELALAAAEQAMRHTERAMVPKLELGATHRVLGQVCEAQGHRNEAAVHLEESLRILNTIQSRPELGQSLLAYGRFKMMDDVSVGREYLGRALRLFEQIGADGWVDEAHKSLSSQLQQPVGE